MISVREVSYAHDGKKCLDHVSLDVAGGEIVGLYGLSGAGKSTLGRIMAGVLAPNDGHVLLDNAPYRGVERGRIATVQYAPQVSEMAVDPRWTIGKILSNGGVVSEGLLDAFGIAPEWKARKPAEISGGQLARVSLARLFLPPVRFVICDEIVAHLDALSAIEVLSTLRDVVTERGIGILLISHNKKILSRFADRIFLLEDARLLPQK